MRTDHRLTAGMALIAFFLIAMLGRDAGAQGQPDGQLTIAFDVSLAPLFLDPAETPGIGTPFVFLYALQAGSVVSAAPQDRQNFLPA